MDNKIIEFLPRIIASWLSMNLFQNKIITYNTEITNLNILIGIIIFIISFIIYTFLNKKIKKIKIDSFFILINYFLCSLFWLNKVNNILYLLSIICFFMIIIIYFLKENKSLIQNIQFNKRKYQISLIFIIFLPFVSLITIGILRYYTYSAPNFDFGIFSHIFYNLKETLIPYSTCERDMLLSHFAVHFSPILYLILPIYYLFSSPLTLQICQVLILYLGLIPLIKICNHYKFTNKKKLFMVLLYSFYPALSTGTFYDFHENCFLPVLLLFVFYFFETANKKLLLITVILTLMVKEDAAIYLTIFSLYSIISKNKQKIGTIILITSVIYFLLTTFFMDKYGLGIMSNRYENLIYENAGLLGAIKTIIFNPGYALTQLLTNPSNNFDKLIYLIKMFLSIMFIPFITKKISRYLLLIPLLINLLTNYVYMYDITFHYSYGILAFLFYLIILNINDMKKTFTTHIFLMSIITTLLSYYCFVFPSFVNNVLDYNINKDNYKKINQVLNMIPKNSSVSSSTFYLPHLTQRKELYEVYYHGNKTDIDYIVLDMRYDDYQEYLDFYLSNNYNIVSKETNLIIVLKKNR